MIIQFYDSILGDIQRVYGGETPCRASPQYFQTTAREFFFKGSFAYLQFQNVLCLNFYSSLKFNYGCFENWNFLWNWTQIFFFLSMHYLARVFYFLYWAHISDINAQLKLEIKWKKLKHDFMIFTGFLVTLLTKIELIAFKVGWDYGPKKSVKLSQPE